VPEVDSRGLEVLAELSEAVAKAGCGLRLSGANKTLREVLALTDLSTLFEHFEDVSAAAGGAR
jgi:anti-anti-sigma regulatory factor